MMKDITRIHIAKVPYNVELSAKKELEKYIGAVELYAGDHEVLEDIEIRMTELLQERGLKQDAVITDADVDAIRQQLGEPKDFMDEDAVEVETFTQENGHRLYRNLDTAVLGGVLGGIASYFKVNPLWIRLVFIIFAFAFGASIIIYLVLWVVVPPARTAAEKLQLIGKPVTLASIQALNETHPPIDYTRRAKMQKRVATFVLGVFAVIGALFIIAGVGLVFGLHPGLQAELDDMYQIPYTLMLTAGVLLIVLLVLIAFAAFAQKFNKKIWISGIVVIVLGLSAFGAGLFGTSYAEQQKFTQVQRDTIERQLQLPEGFADIKLLKVDVPMFVNVDYYVDDKATSVTQKSLKTSPLAKVVVDNNTLSVALKDGSDEINRFADNTITLYGPPLDTLIALNGHVSYNGGTQSHVQAEAYNTASLRLISTRIDTLSVRTDESGQFSAQDASVATANVRIEGYSSVGLGNIKTLNVTSPEVCPSNELAQLTVQNIVSATYKQNGIDAPVKSMKSPCMTVEFGDSTDSY